jgi:hypothetical protein
MQEPRIRKAADVKILSLPKMPLPDLANLCTCDSLSPAANPLRAPVRLLWKGIRATRWEIQIMTRFGDPGYACGLGNGS